MIRRSETHLKTLTATLDDASAAPLPRVRGTRKPRRNEPRFEVRTSLHQLTGVDLSQIDGLAPKNKVSDGRLLNSQTQPSANRAAAILRMVAMSLGRTHTALGAFYSRLAYRVGKAKAITATARKLAILVYRALNGELDYRDPGADAYDARQRTSVLRRLRQRADALGFALVNRETGELLGGTVS